MFISRISYFLFSFLAFILPALTHPIEGQSESQALATTIQDLAALAIINDLTPKPFANITIVDGLTS